MGAKKAKNRKPGLTVSIPPPPTHVTAEQYIAAMRAFQGHYIYAAIALEQMMREKDEQFYRMWFPDTDEQRLNVYIFPCEAITSETSILYDQVPSRLYHHGLKYPILKVPVEIMSMVFHQLPLFDRVNLARCSKRLAKIATEEKVLELEFKDRDELSDCKGFFADPSNFPICGRREPQDTRPQYMGRGRYMHRSRLRDKAGPTRRGFIMPSIYGSLPRWTQTMSAYCGRVIDGVREACNYE